MKFNCGPTWQESFKAAQEWHRHFAIFPVRVGSRDCRWLEWVECKGTFKPNVGQSWKWEYRAIE